MLLLTLDRLLRQSAGFKHIQLVAAGVERAGQMRAYNLVISGVNEAVDRL